MKTASPSPGRLGAFSLVEIALALGIVSFALAGIVGLLSATLQTSRSSMDDLLVSEMTSNFVNSIRKQDFTNISSNPTNVFFDMSGKMINGMDTSTGLISNVTAPTAVAQGAVYVCTAQVTSDAALEADGAPNLWNIRLMFQWPAGTPSTNSQKIIHAFIARY